MDISPKVLLGSLPVYAGLLASQHQVDLRIDAHAHTTSTNGRTITLPALPIPDKASDVAGLQDLATLAYGYVTHEVGHIQDSRFDVALEAVDFGMLNAIEDPRQELSLIASYPGTRIMLNDLSLLMIRKDMGQAVNAALAPRDQVALTVHAWLRAEIREEPWYQPIAEQGMAILRESLGEAVVIGLHALLAEHGTTMSSTEDAVDLANAIDAMLKAEAEKDQAPESTQGNSDASDAGNGNRSQSDPASGDGSDTDSGNGTPQDSASNGSADAGDPNAPQGATGSGSADANAPQDASPQPSPGGRSQAQKDALSQAAAQASSFADRGAAVTQQIASQSTAVDKACGGNVRYVLSTDNCAVTPVYAASGGPLDVDQATMTSVALRQRMRVLLEATARANTRIRDRGRQLSNRHLPRLAFADARVFKHSTETKGLNTAVMLVLDSSGSMRGHKQEVANNACYATALACESFRDVKLGAIAFPDNALMKHFDTPLQRSQPAFAMASGGSTPMADALMASVVMMSQRREDRKLLIVMSDGEADDVMSARDAVAVARSRGIEVIGIGICDHHIRDVIPERYEIIQNLDELQERLIGLLQAELLAA